MAITYTFTAISWTDFKLKLAVEKKTTTYINEVVIYLCRVYRATLEFPPDMNSCVIIHFPTEELKIEFILTWL